MNITNLSINNIFLLEEFLSSAGSSLKTFGYFNKRDKSVLDNHVVTFIGILNGAPVAYGHLDRDGDKVWLGIAVSESYRGKGLGNKMIERLMMSAKENCLTEINLSVLKRNNVAYKLFEKYGFKWISENKESYFYRIFFNNIKSSSKVLFLGRKEDEYCLKALTFCQENFEEVKYYLNEWGDRIPENIGQYDCDYIIAYLSTWIIPEYVLKNVKVAAINFHPGSPDYPGIGCTNFALSDDAQEYGATCHHMTSKVDTGAIISFKTFPISASDTVTTLTSKTYNHQLVLFYDVMAVILNGEQLPKSEKQWQRKPFTRKELGELAKIAPSMSKDEIARRIRATSYKNWQPTLEIHGFEFEFKPEKSD